MKSMVNIGSKVEREAIAELAKSIDVIFTSAAKNRIDEESLRAALGQLGNLGSVNGASITGSSFSAPGCSR